MVHGKERTDGREPRALNCLASQAGEAGSSMNPQIVNREALLDDLRFWCLLYESWLKPCVGDPFEEGEEYFFSIREYKVHDLFHELEEIAVTRGHYPAVSVAVTLPSGWRAGVDLMMCPEDFEFDYVVVPPGATDHKIIGVHGGNHWLPALRWEEVLLLADAVAPRTAVSRARGILLFYPACIPAESCKDEVKETLRLAWSEFGFSVEHLDEWIERTAQDTGDSRWRHDPNHGWICESDHSLRNPKWIERHHRWTSGMLSAVAQLFSSIESAAPEPRVARSPGGPRAGELGC